MSQPYIGEVRLFGGNFAPVGWNFCDGSLLSIAQWSALFNLIGTTYGGDGLNTFGVPDLRGRAVIHQGTGAGLSPYVIGQPVGVENVTVTTQQMALHPHTFSGNNSGGTSPNPATTAVLAAAPTGYDIYDGTGTPTALIARSVSNTGGSAPHNNRQPCLAITYIIALEGIYPSQG